MRQTAPNGSLSARLMSCDSRQRHREGVGKGETQAYCVELTLLRGMLNRPC
jgi:hypothetical protein